MIMSRNTFSRIAFCAVLMLCTCFSSRSQTYTGYAPYTMYGVGDFAMPGTAYNRSMGGVGIAGRTNRFINVLNPASITERDSLSFMADFSLAGDNKIFTQGDMKSVSNTFNVLDCAMSFPIYKSLSAMFGVSPYSSTGYNYSFDYDDPAIIGNAGNISYAASGKGALYQTYGALGVTLFDRLSLGAEAIFYFGSNEKTYYGLFSNSSYNGVKNGQNIQLNAFSGKFGLQYEQPLGTKDKLILGATYTMPANLRGYIEDYSYSSGAAAVDTLYHRVDTLAHNPGKLRLAGEVGVGICYTHADKFMIEMDYTRSDWTGCGFDNTPGFRGNTSRSATTSVFTATTTQAFRLGFEIVPNRSDIRYYFKKVAYRGGAYYKDEYYLLDGHKINSMGITLGATFPVFKWYNGITVAVDLGQRGTISDNLIRERYVNFSVGMNIFDIWFHKQRYD